MNSDVMFWQNGSTTWKMSSYWNGNSPSNIKWNRNNVTTKYNNYSFHDERNYNCHYVRPSFTVSLLSRRNFSWSSHYSKSLQGIEWFSQLAGLQWLTVLSMLIGPCGITTGDWHILSCYVTLFWLRVKFNRFPSCEYNMWCEDSPKWGLNS